MDDPTRLLRLVHSAHRREPIPTELAPWLAGLALATMSSRERDEARDACIQRAASLIPGKRWKKMRRVQRELAEVREEWTLHRRYPPPPGSITAHVVDALLIDWEMPASVSQLLRILKEDED